MAWWNETNYIFEPSQKGSQNTHNLTEAIVVTDEASVLLKQTGSKVYQMRVRYLLVARGGVVESVEIGVKVNAHSNALWWNHFGVTTFWFIYA